MFRDTKECGMLGGREGEREERTTCELHCLQSIHFCSSLAEDQVKALLTSWISFAVTALKKSSVALDVKFDVMNMCFCLIGITKISQVQIEMKLSSLCDQVEVGIHNEILSLTPSSKGSAHVLGHRVNVKEELKVSFG